ncbi:hypothetical protein [Liquorilactobacillus uvarum]|uniref:hypothetical protein n=1 Tax=Liquorilactobacillus uvarum TaxID=303240 RepID=UPI00288BFBB8|nr:hypothetical protein [Liquorilactobacillus uvarum]
MNNFGITVKSLREKRGFQIKEVYSGVIGRTTAFRFEKGETNISTQKLLKVLYNMGIYSMDEFLFFYEQGKDNVFNNDLDKHLTHIMQEEERNIKSKKHVRVFDFYKKYENSKKKEEKFLAYAAHFDYLINQNENIGKKLRLTGVLKEFQLQWDYIERYLLDIETWSFRELDWFPFLSGCFHEEARPLLLARFKKNFKELKGYYEHWEKHYSNNLINYLMNSVYMGYYGELEEDMKEVDYCYQMYPELRWELSQRCRVLYIKVIIAGLKQNIDQIKKNYLELTEIEKIMGKDNELMEFYLEDSLKKIQVILPKLNINSVI